MTEINQLYEKLLSAYSNKNLNKIAGKIIELYQNQNFDEIRNIAERISGYVIIDEEKDSKCFSKLILQYHPDKGGTFRDQIKKHYEEKDHQALEKFSHIFLMKDIENTQVRKIDNDLENEFEHDPIWEDERDNDGYFYDEDEIDGSEYFDFEDYSKSFYNELKMRLYGKLNVEFPPNYLEEFDDFEMTGCEMENLDGIEYCRHIITLDVSNNYIVDISGLSELEKIEELYLANNQIGLIDSLSKLYKLNTIDISGNMIDDITPLFGLENLRFLNILGNPVPKDQIAFLMNKGVIVIS